MHSTQPARPATPSISDAMVRQFVDDGYLVVPGLVSAEEIEILKRDTADIARGKYPCKNLQPVDPSLSDSDVLERLLCIHQPHYISPVAARFVSHPGIVAVLARIVGAHLADWDGRVKCMQSMLFVKPPGKPGQAWHQDEEYIPTRDRSLCGAWIAIDDATQANGCLWVLPGSHRHGYIYPFKPPVDLEEFDGSNESYGFEASSAVPVEVASGSVVFFNGYLLHRSLRNRSGIYRRALVNHYMSSWSRLPWYETNGHGAVALADNRCVVQVAGEDPYAHLGYAAPTKDVYLRTFGKAWQEAEPNPAAK